MGPVIGLKNIDAKLGIPTKSTQFVLSSFVISIHSKGEMVSLYCEGRKLFGLGDIDFWVIMSMFRLASILVGVGARYVHKKNLRLYLLVLTCSAKKGNATSEMASLVGSFAVKFSDCACDIVKANEQVPSIG